MYMNRYDLVIFDVDGTILDTSEGVISAVKHTIEELKFTMLPDEALAGFIGPPIQDSFAKVYGISGSMLQDIASVFRDYYKETDLFKAVPYEGIHRVFQELEKREMLSAIATYKREDYAVTLLNHFGFDRYTGNMHGADHENKRKKKDIIEMCISESGITDKSKVVMIGDTEHDAIGAELTGIDFIGVVFGFGFKSVEDIARVKHVGCCVKAEDILHFL